MNLDELRRVDRVDREKEKARQVHAGRLKEWREQAEYVSRIQQPLEKILESIEEWQERVLEQHARGEPIDPWDIYVAVRGLVIVEAFRDGEIEIMEEKYNLLEEASKQLQHWQDEFDRRRNLFAQS